eukprot:3935279-Rhodomonas_salina.1
MVSAPGLSWPDNCTCLSGYFLGVTGCEDVNECRGSELAHSCRDPVTGRFDQTCASTQSSTSSGLVSTFALDKLGKAGTTYGQCSATNNPSNSWWRIDLQDSASLVSQVRIWNLNTPTTARDRLLGFQIAVTSTSDTATYRNVENICYTHTGGVATSTNTPILAPCNKRGRYVWIYLPANYLNLCEVEIYDFSLGENNCDASATCTNTP